MSQESNTSQRCTHRDSLSDINYINDLEATGEFGEFVCYTYGEKHGGRCVFYTKDKKLTKLTKPLLIY